MNGLLQESDLDTGELRKDLENILRAIPSYIDIILQQRNNGKVHVDIERLESRKDMSSLDVNKEAVGFVLVHHPQTYSNMSAIDTSVTGIQRRNSARFRDQISHFHVFRH